VNVSSNNQNVEFILTAPTRATGGAYGAGYIIVDGGSIFDNNSGNTATTLRHFQISLVNGGQLSGGNWETRSSSWKAPLSHREHRHPVSARRRRQRPVWVAPSTAILAI